jgi:hypothetical protein
MTNSGSRPEKAKKAEKKVEKEEKRWEGQGCGSRWKVRGIDRDGDREEAGIDGAGEGDAEGRNTPGDLRCVATLCGHKLCEEEKKLCDYR